MAAEKSPPPPPAPAAVLTDTEKDKPPAAAAPAKTDEKEKEVASGPQKPPKAELPEDQWCDAKKNALTVNLERAERGSALNLGLGPEWDAFIKDKK